MYNGESYVITTTQHFGTGINTKQHGSGYDCESDMSIGILMELDLGLPNSLDSP